MKNLVLIIATVLVSFTASSQESIFSLYEEVDFDITYKEQGFNNAVKFEQPDGSFVYEMFSYTDSSGVQAVLLQADLILMEFDIEGGAHDLDYDDFLVGSHEPVEEFCNNYELPDGGILKIGLMDIGISKLVPFASVLYENK